MTDTPKAIRLECADFVLAEDHDRIVAELTGKIEALNIVCVTRTTGNGGESCPVTIT